MSYRIRYFKDGRLVRATPWSGTLDSAKNLARKRLTATSMRSKATMAEVIDDSGKIVFSVEALMPTA
jgi:hypothetical protein